MIKTDKPRAINFKIIDNVKKHRTGKFRPCKTGSYAKCFEITIEGNKLA